MKKLTISILASLWIALLGFNTANSDVVVGLTGSMINVEASGTETDSADSGTENSTRTKDVDELSLVGSIYAEYVADNGFTLGLEYYPGAADVSDKAHTRTDTEKSVTSDATENSDSRKFTANAEVENYGIAYVELGTKYFVRAGYSQLDLNTLEVKTSNGGNYPNVTLNGINYGAGIKGEMGDNLNWKLFYEATNWDDISLVSTGNSVTSETNTITADLDTSEFKFALGYRF